MVRNRSAWRRAAASTLFWLASGRVVHEAETPNEQLVAAATLPAPSLARVASNFPSAIAEVIDKALEFTKANRFRDAFAMKSALHEAVQSVSWGNRRPSIDFSIAPAPQEADETVVEMGQPLRPLAAKLPMSGDEAPTIDTRNARAPTIGPVETMAPPPKRSTQYLKAALIGLSSAVTLLGVMTLVAKKINAPIASATVPAAIPTPTPSPTPSPLPSSPTVTPSASVVASAEPAVSVAPVITAATQHVPHPPPTATPRNNWLDRRK